MPVTAKPTNIVVNTTADSEFPIGGGCSLRAAILAANGAVSHGNCPAGTNEEDSDRISFALGSGIPTINLASALPAISQPVAINGAGAATRVKLHGPGSGTGLHFTATADQSLVSNLEIDAFTSGILSLADGLWIRGNVIGPNEGIGIVMYGDGATIGGTGAGTSSNPCTGYCNRIVGHNEGIWTNGTTTIQANVIGLDAAGLPVPNRIGIDVVNVSATIGGATADAGNVVSGNSEIGILLQGCIACVVQGNHVGTDPAGTAGRPNGSWGIEAAYADDLVIGGAGSGQGNVISGNVGGGVHVAQSADVVISGNRIGTGTTGGAVGNAGDGIWIEGKEFVQTNATIGMTATGARNTISNNAGAGVRITAGADEPANGNSVRGNSIFGNANVGIVLENGANQGIDPPVISGLRPVRGSGACAGCLVDVYSDSADEGRVHEGTAVVDAFGSWSLPGLFTGPNVTATVTDASGNTSAFSAPLVPTTPFTDIAGSPFMAEITWLYANGITAGCAPTLYCPSGSVTREQMASFLARMFALPPSLTDYFTDDETSTHEMDINRLALSGITSGCAPGKFCPKGHVLRDQMASFLARATGLTIGGGRDYFNDDDGNTHEINIDRNAAAGLTTGCGSYTYCPSGNVTREQMAAFLRRVLVPVTPPPYPAH